MRLQTWRWSFEATAKNLTRIMNVRCFQCSFDCRSSWLVFVGKICWLLSQLIVLYRTGLVFSTSHSHIAWLSSWYGRPTPLV